MQHTLVYINAGFLLICLPSHIAVAPQPQLSMNLFINFLIPETNLYSIASLLPMIHPSHQHLTNPEKKQLRTPTSG
jgi:hypothetical protein